MLSDQTLRPDAALSVATPPSKSDTYKRQRSCTLPLPMTTASSADIASASANMSGVPRIQHGVTFRDLPPALMLRDSSISQMLRGQSFSPPRRHLGSMMSMSQSSRLSVTYPEVEITVKVYHVSNFELRHQRFYVDFVLMCDWIDPQLIGLDPDIVNMADYFCPEIAVHNALHDFAHLSDGASEHADCKLFDPDLGWVKWTKRFRGNLSTGELNCMTYPFESQALPIVFKAKKRKGTFLTLSHSTLRRQYDEQFAQGHVIDAAGSQLTEYMITGISGVEVHRERYGSSRNHSYQVRILVRRQWDHVVWNILFPMFLLSLLSFVVYFIELEDLPNRFQVTLTLLLTVIAFKLCTRELLPAVSYLTVLDHYIIHTILIFWSNAWEHAIVTQLNYWYGRHVARTVEIAWLMFTFLGSLLCHLWLLWNWWGANSVDKKPKEIIEEPRDDAVVTTKKLDGFSYQELET
eukprot:GEMP01041836.1.p1 GENE.GEMP01041836.1~~GEMP01041836.1.p1  ORF type:complete len:463 (+),score=68.84 GEMP01041836.1:308-1696(+)